MEKLVSDFSWGLFLWQALSFLVILAVIFLIYRFIKKRNKI